MVGSVFDSQSSFCTKLRPRDLTDRAFRQEEIGRYDVINPHMLLVVFLKKTVFHLKDLSCLRKQSRLTVLGRQLVMVDYADDVTRSALEKGQAESTLALIKPDAYESIGHILGIIIRSGLKIKNLKMLKLTRQQSERFYQEHSEKSFFPFMIDYISSDVVVAIELIGENAVAYWRELIGPTDPIEARGICPESIRAKFGVDGTKNAVHGSDSRSSAIRELEFFFNAEINRATTAVCDNCALLMIKPSFVNTKSGEILTMLLANQFEISALEMVTLDMKTAEEFYEVYKGILPKVRDVICDISSGPVLVAEIRQENVVPRLRSLVGPHDPAVARRIYPESIRAKFGIDRVQNAVHCTDLEDDGVLECRFFFEILKANYYNFLCVVPYKPSTICYAP